MAGFKTVTQLAMDGDYYKLIYSDNDFYLLKYNQVSLEWSVIGSGYEAVLNVIEWYEANKVTT